MDVDILRMVEDDLDDFKKISILFLMLDNYQCFTRVLDLYQNDCKNIISEFVNEIEEWNEKILEALCIIQNFRVLRNLGESVEDLKLKYLPYETRISYKINVGAKILYKLFDSFDKHDARKFLDIVYKDIPRCERLNGIDILELDALYWIDIGYISISPCGGDLGILLKHLKQRGQYDTPIYIDIEYYVKDNNKRIKDLKVKSVENFQKCEKSTENIYNLSTEFSVEKIFIEKGICLIINEMHFPHTEFESRESSENDALNLEKTFTGMNFEVKLYNDIPAQEIIDTLDKLVATNTNNYDCFVLCILSHGYPGGFISVDGTEISIDIIEQKICSTAYKNAVKILIVQACQGQNTGLTVDSINFTTDGKIVEITKRESTNIDDYKLFFSFMSTMKHHISIRHRIQGSWFIEDVCEVLRSTKTLGKHISIDQWSKEVKKKVQSRRGYIRKGELAGQLPETRDRLSKEVYFPLYENKSDI